MRPPTGSPRKVTPVLAAGSGVLAPDSAAGTVVGSRRVVDPARSGTLRGRIPTRIASGVDPGAGGAYPPTSLTARPGRRESRPGWHCRFAGCALARHDLAWLVAVRLWLSLAVSSSGSGAPAHTTPVPGLVTVLRCSLLPG